MRSPIPFDLADYHREFAPDLEVRPREPVFAVGLVSAKGVPFVLVREAVGRDVYGGSLAWLVWREHACVGYVGTTTSGFDPFGAGSPVTSTRRMPSGRAVDIWRSLIVDGTGNGTGADVLATLPSRVLGIMTRAYIEIVRQVSEHGCALVSNPKARSAGARALWRRLHATPGIEIVKRRRAGAVREYAFMLASAPELEGPTVVRERQA